MARPRVIKLANGAEIKLKNVAKEDAAKIEKALATKSEEAQDEETPAAAVTVLPAPETLREPAIGITRFEGSYYIVTVRFNNEMNQCMIGDKAKVDGNLQAAIEEFKIKAVELGIV